MHGLATAGSRLGTERATVPRIVLPIRSRGLELTDRVCWAILGAAMLAAAALILYLTRGTVFFVDELERFQDSPTLGLVDVIEPHAGHLTATANVVYKAILETVGADYVAFRVLIVCCVLLATGLFYTLAKRRIGALPALAPAIVLLFFGSSWQMIATGLGFNIVFSVALGLGALLALERGDRLGDAIACALVTASVATFSIGLAFLVGVAISVLLAPDRRRRAWIFIVPAALYAAWWIWAQSAPEPAGTGAKASNVLLIPSYVAASLAAVLGSLAGLSFEFNAEGAPSVSTQTGIVLAVVATAALAARIRRGKVPRFLWVALGILLAFWTLSALARNEFRPPGQIRYLYTGAVGVLLVAAAAASELRFSRAGVAILFAVAAVSLGTNLILLRDGTSEFRNVYSAPLRANLAMVELTRDEIPPEFNYRAGVPALSISTELSAAEYLAASGRYGSLGFSLSELAAQPEPIRQRADRTLVRATGIALEPSRSPPARGCGLARSESPGGPLLFPVPAGGATLTAAGDAPATLTVGRFAALPSVEVGDLVPDQGAALAVPDDESATPWRGLVTGANSVRVCPLS